MAKKPDSSAKPGHNSVAVDRLRSLVNRIERLEEERKALGSDIRDIYAEAKAAGFDTKALRSLVRLRKREPSELEEEIELINTYRRALGEEELDL